VRERNSKRYTEADREVDAAIAAGVSLRMRAQLLIRAWWNRRQVRRLLELGDDQLDDLGICRMDVLLALRRRISEDPSAMLVTWRDERWASAQRRQAVAIECHSDNHAIDARDANMTI
jgi:uncharacterized protein YjiS (DUF1127 family)